MIPVHPTDAMLHATALSHHSDEFCWTCPGDGDAPSHEATLTMEMDERYVMSLSHLSLLRQGTYGSFGPSLLVDASDPYVKEIAKHILSETESYSEYGRANAALHFVQDVIGYSYDQDLFGVPDFYAHPSETLYLRQGDCEDTSILLCSILGAMGYGCVLLDYPGHVAVGVRLSEGPDGHRDIAGKDYWFCETTASDCDAGIGWMDEWSAHSPGEQEALSDSLKSAMARIRTAVREVVGT